MAACKNKLPQTGTYLSEVGESRSDQTLSPSYSGGGDKCHDVGGSSVALAQKTAASAAVDEERLAGSLLSDSDMSVQSMPSARSLEAGGRLWKSSGKRKRKNEVIHLSSDEEKGNLKASKKSSFSSILSDSGNRRKEFLVQKRQETEDELEVLTSKACENRAALRLEHLDGGDSRTANALNQRVIEDIAIILKVATKSGNLKGTYVRHLKEAGASIKAAVEALHSRTTSEETAKLQADNTRLQGEIAELRKEMAELRKDMASVSKAPIPPQAQSLQRMEVSEVGFTQEGGLEDLTRTIMLQVGSMVNSRLEGLEERLLPEKRLRPSLAADRRNAAAALTLPKSQGGVDLSSRKSPTPKDRKGNKKQKVFTATSLPVQSTSCPLTTATKTGPGSSTSSLVLEKGGWSTVKRRGKTKKKPKATAQAQGLTSRTRNQMVPVKLRAPRSAAVVITLQPEAEKRGITYAKVLGEAREKIDLASCGITGLRFRKAATGGRILEIPGVSSGEKADSLAQKLRDALDMEVTKVSRPVKCSEIRISGLDDSVSAAEICNAVAQRGGCSVESIKAGEIQQDFQGSYSIWVRCPVTAAKTLEETGRLLIGWVAARVTLLQPRPMRCYRCLHNGHVRAQCTAEVDRSNECYRCGRTGHKAAKCSAVVPKCSLCAAANKPANHRLGSKSCSPPKPKKGMKVAATADKSPIAISCPSSLQGGEEMITSN